MTIYADVVFAVNACVDYLMLCISARVTGAAIRNWRLALAAVIGGVYAAAALAPGCAVLQQPWMKLLVWGAMLALGFGVCRKTLKLGLVFLAACFAFGGIVFAMVQLLGTGVMLLPGGAFYPVSSGALLALAGATYLFAWLVFSRLAEHSGGQIVPLTLTLDGRSVTVRALRDSGNTLKDPMTNEPVLVADWQTAETLLPARLQRQELADPAALMTKLSAQTPPLHARLIPYRAVGTQAGLLLAVRCQAAVKNGKARPALLAFSPTSVSDAGNFEVLTGG